MYVQCFPKSKDLAVYFFPLEMEMETALDAFFLSMFLDLEQM
jgi:hypothetical protein